MPVKHLFQYNLDLFFPSMGDDNTSKKSIGKKKKASVIRCLTHTFPHPQATEIRSWGQRATC